jgi:hypothetical protein
MSIADAASVRVSPGIAFGNIAGNEPPYESLLFSKKHWRTETRSGNMLRLGVCHRSHFYSSAPKGPMQYLRYQLSRNRVSFQLLDMNADAEANLLFEHLIPYVRLSNGVYKTTSARRFAELDISVNAVISRSFPKDYPLRVADWAASTCLTSLEWAESLLPLFPRLTFEASDRTLVLIEITSPDSRCAFIAEPDGAPLQLILPPFVIQMDPPERWITPINRLLFEHAQRKWNDARLLWPLPESWVQDLSDCSRLELNGYRLRKLPLVHPRAMRAARHETTFLIRKQSVFTVAPKQSHVIRTMNILNKFYFPDSELIQGARAISASLLPGGIWILGRTIDDAIPSHQVSILQKGPAGKMTVLERVGAGSEIESIALAGEMA